MNLPGAVEDDVRRFPLDPGTGERTGRAGMEWRLLTSSSTGRSRGSQRPLSVSERLEIVADSGVGYF